MSNYYGFWCPQCQEGTGHGWNHGGPGLTWLLEHWGPVHDFMSRVEFATNVAFCPYKMMTPCFCFDVNPIDFLIDHYEHGVIVRSEYDPCDEDLTKE